MQDLSKKVLLLNIMLTQAILLVIAIAIKFFWAQHLSLNLLLEIRITPGIIAVLLLGILLLLFLQLLFYKYVPRHELAEELNRMLMEKFSLSELCFIFFTGALIEEFLFRFLLQSLLGITLTSLIFALIHVRYISKKYMLLEVFLLSVILGIIFEATSMFYVPVVCHFVLNILTALLIKKGFITLDPKV
ncbi:MAG: CPBP family intramembrane metalloprotease [Peptococcaceae bacterium]|jgi:membrane protease YdiL (CAAX protease family)|nr:CPBP family intramembrane metalloprotease [Peptococcaceae bacterium]